MSNLNVEQIIDLLYYLGTDKVVYKPGNKWIQFNCTVHNESHPSAGVNIENNIYNCFSCGSSGTLDWLCYNSNKDEFKSVAKAREFLEKRYKVKFDEENELDFIDLNDYDEVKNNKKIKLKKSQERTVLPIKTIAPYRSGKETYKYFFSRGFTKQTMIDFKVGRDIVNKTVTVPIFYEDKQLAGVIGRYISKNCPKNERYKVYDFEKSSVTFPQDKLEVKDNTIILVEGLLDALWMHQNNYCNTQAILGNKLTRKQANYLKSKAKIFIRAFDNDEGGERAKLSFDKLMSGVKVYDVTYPKGVKDVQEMDKSQLDYMFNNLHSPISQVIHNMKRRD